MIIDTEVKMSFSDCAGYTNAELVDPDVLNKIVEKKLEARKAARGNGKSTLDLIQYLRFQGLTDEEIKEMFKLGASMMEQN